MGGSLYQLTVHRRFSAAHVLRDYEGPCSRLHGHNYEVEVTVARNSLDPMGMVMDFGELKRICDEVIESLDHRLLNDLAPFKDSNATSELIAQHVFKEIQGRLGSAEVRLESVRVWETPTSAATYREV